MPKRTTYEELEKRFNELQKEVAFEKVATFSKDETDSRIEKPGPFAGIITNNNGILSIFQYIQSIGKTSQPVLITGETGVGKELIARAIHRLSGLKGRFVAVNAAGLDDNLFSDTLFGHGKGAFTGADRVRRGLIQQATGGTLFLDEIGDLGLASQVKLLRLLEEGEYLALGQDEPKYADIRIVASTNKDLWELQRADKFRKDLNFRLRTHHVHIPPLRKRMDDIPLLVDHFLNQAVRALNKKKPALPKELFKILGVYSFPGNVRELQAMVFDAVSRHTAKTLSIDVFKSYIAQNQENRIVPTEREAEQTASMTFTGKLPTIKEATRLLVAEAMRRAGGNQSFAAKMLGISQQALSKRLKSDRQRSAV
jgi:DNA-binding NtrC family response regulator